MKHSIKRQMIAVFLGLLLTFVAALFIINIYFLEPYYIGNKKTQFIEMYEKLNQAIRDGMLRNGILKEEVSGELAYLAEKNNISFLIADDRGGYLTNVHDKEQLNNQQDSGQYTGLSDRQVMESVESYGLYRDVGRA